ncbi:MAG: hypothetical protein NVSMB52_12040 [Chloroflexota bacterium]
MPWPTPQDYNEAIQSPQLSFQDPDLRAGRAETTVLGLPRPITGNFASVYKIECPGSDWAVRCFWREYADMQARYAAISSHVRAAHLPYTVGFEYIPQGICVHGHWYPILKMEWVTGVLLDEYIRIHLHDSRALSQLAERWSDMVNELERARIAHGDLQHGNVLVANDQLKLVDYDGMFVPALAGRGSHEVGHQNYQSPGRQGSDFDEHTDRFAAWVIYLSLKALSKAPDLWTELNAGDECLLFRRGDFLHPEGSRAIRSIDGVNDEELRSKLKVFCASLSGNSAPLPLLRSPRSAHVRSASAPGLRRRRLHYLWKRAVPNGNYGPAAESHVSTSRHPSWLIDHIPQTSADRSFGGPFREPRITAALAAVAFVLAVLSSVTVLSFSLLEMSVLGATGIFLNISVLLVWFHRDPVVRELKTVINRKRLTERTARRLARKKEQLEFMVTRVESKHQLKVDRARKRVNTLQKEELHELDRVPHISKTHCDRAAERLRENSSGERAELDSALKAIQSLHVRTHLRNASLRTAALPKVPWLVKVRMWAMGIHSAGDVTTERIDSVRSLGKEVVSSIVEWRVSTELEARKTAPQVIDARACDQIKRRWALERARIEFDRQSAEEASRITVQAIKERYHALFIPLHSAIAHDELEHTARTDQLQREINELDKSLQLTLTELRTIRGGLEPFRNVTFARYMMRVVAPHGPGASGQLDA